MGALDGRTALVTGASRGIGRGIALRLAQDGALVAVHYGSNEAAARETAGLIGASGGRAVLVRAELGMAGDAETLYERFDAVLEEIGEQPGLDILVNNAGMRVPSGIHEVTPENFDRLVAVNAKAPLFIAQHALRRLRDGGRIVNISSAATRIAHPEGLGYSMTKGAVDVLTLALAKQLGDRGITVNTVAPGYVATDLNAWRRTTPEAAATLAAQSVFRRIGDPADVADIVAFLVSDSARWITGQRIDASGGTRL
ncbi:SDR family oxidoreductase [Kitasatospora sp. NPDC006697]|uniref:SDR family oxidoreductase n=1 Tax=Kitasatospora sp. NPDC006697 TaxID=3364020 RepID=UPI00368AF095